jgi:2'-5' RNA ligase
MPMKRLFTAVDITTDIADELAGLQSAIKQRLGPGMRASWVPPEDIHLTLKFLGSVEADLVGPLGDVMRDVAGTEPPFELEVQNIGAFPTPGNPRVLWVGADPESATLLDRIHEQLETRYHDDFDIDRDEHSFQPHFTLGRIKSNRAPDLIDMKPELPDGPFGACRIKHVSMYESELTHEGAEYTEVRRAPLSG